MKLAVHHKPRSNYTDTWQQMKQVVSTGELALDQLWLLEHSPVLTQGIAGKPHHIIQQSNIPVVQSDRGGQITYHGPGQMMAYTLLKMKNHGIGPRQLVNQLQRTTIKTLKQFDIEATCREGAPGVYVADKKIASIGLRIKKGISYHGLALNVDMDLKPFNCINPCGFAGLKMCQIKDFNPNITMDEVKSRFTDDFIEIFGYTHYQVQNLKEHADAIL